MVAMIHVRRTANEGVVNFFIAVGRADENQIVSAMHVEV